MTFTGSWRGNLSGTNSGSVQADLCQEGEQLTGEIVFEDIQYGRTVARLNGTVNGSRVKAHLYQFQGMAPRVPTAGHIEAESSEGGSLLSGQWGTNIGTGGSVTLKREGNPQSPALSTTVITPGGIRQTPSSVPSALIVDFKNIPIEPFRTSVSDLRELVNAFSVASRKARELEEGTIRERCVDGVQQQIQIASIPLPSVEITGDDGRFMLFSKIENFNSSDIPSNLKSLNLYSYKQGGYFPNHGVQVRVNNVNGTDLQNPIGLISVHGSDPTWVLGTFESLKQFFIKRKTRRALLHQQATGNLVLYGLVFPLAFWTLFRTIGMLPSSYRDVPFIHFGLFVYLYAAFYLGFDKLLFYLRWTLPSYEVEFSSPHKRQRHRYVAWAIIIGLITAFLYDFIKFIL
jgi:hypothetical protein